MKELLEYYENIRQLDELYNQLKIDKIYIKTDDSTELSVENKVSSDNDINLLKNIKSLFDKCFCEGPNINEEFKHYMHQFATVARFQERAMNDQKLCNSKDVKKTSDEIFNLNIWRKNRLDIIYVKNTLDKVSKIIIQIQDILSPKENSAVVSPAFSPTSTPVFVQSPVYTSPTIKIGKILENIQNASNNVPEELDRQTARIKELLNIVNLTLDDEYAKLHTDDNINKITRYVRELNIKNDGKRARIRYLKKIMEYACNESSSFGRNLLNLLPKFPRTPKYEVESYTAYTEEELKKMFDPKYDFFKEDPDVFWAILIALFTGSRYTAAITLQYGNFPVEEGIQCIRFNKNHPLKKTKNDATVRTIPLHSTLIDLGFLDYIRRHKKERKATDKDFIFPDCQTSSGKCTEHFFDRVFFPFLKEINIKKENTKEYTDHHAFHSFRTNINKALIKANIDETFRNDIIGLEGSSVNQKHYSKHTIPEIKEQLEKLHYDFLEPSFKKWKEILAEK